MEKIKEKLLYVKSDTNGTANFVLEDPKTIQDGTYIFEVRANPIPVGYILPDTQTIKVSVLDGKITDIIGVTTPGVITNFTKSNNIRENLNETFSNIAYIDFAMEPDSNTTSYLKIAIKR